MDLKQASRFIYVPNFVHEGRVDKEAFLPPESRRPYETSVILHDDTGIDWGVGRLIGQCRKIPKQLVGSAEFNEIDAVLSELEIQLAPSSISSRHANLKGWDETDKLRRLFQAEMIAMRSAFIPAFEHGLLSERSFNEATDNRNP